MDFKRVIPTHTLPRYNGDKRVWLPPERILLSRTPKNYIAYYYSKFGRGRKKIVKITLPKIIDIDNKFLVALAYYACEGRNSKKGAYTKSAGNKGRDIEISNTDPRILRLIIDEFESKLGLEREHWVVRLSLSDRHDAQREIEWWGKQLSIPQNQIRVREVLRDTDGLEGYAVHGRAHVGWSSSIYAALIYNLCEKLLDRKLS